ncbi:hypothetical protein CsatB_004850 [Cannabis sativa]
MTDIARSHGGDGGSDPPLGPTNIGADCVRAPPKKRGHHKGLSTREKRENLKRPLPIEWDIKGKTYKEMGPYCSDFSRELGLLVRQYTDPNYLSWAEVPNSVKKRILSRVEDNLFDIGRERYGSDHLFGILTGIDKSCAKKYSEFKHQLKQHLENNGPTTPYAGCTLDQWKKAIEFFELPNVKKRSEINALNRKKLKELSHGGSQSIPALRYKRRDPKSGRLAPIPDAWQATHHKQGKGWVTDTARETWEKMIAIRETQQTQSIPNTEVSGNVINPEDEDLSLVQSVFGRHRGHQKGYGRLISTREMTGPPTFTQPPPPQTGAYVGADVIADMQKRIRQLEELVRTNGVTPRTQNPPQQSDHSDDGGAS